MAEIYFSVLYFSGSLKHPVDVLSVPNDFFQCCPSRQRKWSSFGIFGSSFRAGRSFRFIVPMFAQSKLRIVISV